MTLAPRRSLPVAVLALIAIRAGAQQASSSGVLKGGVAPSIGQAVVELGVKGALGTDRLVAIIQDPRPLARVGAARLVRVLEARALVPRLLAALATESDPTAAAEMAAAIGAMTAGAEADEALFAAAARFSGAIDGAVLRGCGQRDPATATLLPRLLTLKADPDAWRDFFEWFLGRGAAPLDAAADAVVNGGNGAAWTGLLTLSSEAGHPLATSALERALASPDAGVRETTAWYLVRRARTEAVDRAWLARVAESLPEAHGQGDTIQRLAHELLRRAAGLPAHDQSGSLAAMDHDVARRLPADLAIVKALSADERRAGSRAAYGDSGSLDDVVKHAPKDDGGERRANKARWMGTPGDLIPGLAEEAMAAGGCRIDGTPWALLEVRHGADGRRQGFGIVVPKEISPACEPVIRGLLLSTLIPPRERPEPGETRLVLMPLEPAYFACVAERSPSPRPPVRPQPGRIAEPTKIRNVAPTYPLDMREKRIQGTVVLESVVSTQGCISSTEVVRSVDPYLDMAALRAVSQWRYTPTLLDGAPVPVIMTVTVYFKLS